jgi:hypothetical protein
MREGNYDLMLTQLATHGDGRRRCGVVVGTDGRHRGLRMEWICNLPGRDRLMLLLKLTTLLSLVSLDSFPFLGWEHLLVFNPELPTLELHMIHSVDNMSRLLWVSEICKGKTSEDAVVEVVIESIRKRQLHFRHESNKLLLLDCERYVFDNDSGRDELFAFEPPRGRRRATLRLLHHLRVELTVHLIAVHVLRLLLHLWIHPNLHIFVSLK